MSANLQLNNDYVARGGDDRAPSLPPYDRSALNVGIVHFGVGGFHRAHQAYYLDDLMRQGQAFDWAICGVGILPQDKRMKEVLEEQDGLYTLIEKHPDGRVEARVIGSIVSFLHAPSEPEAVLSILVAPSTRIVSLTITEGGYSIDPATGEFDASSPLLRADLARPEVPQSAFGYIVEALRRRREAGIEPFTLQSCDNIQGNGDIAREAIAAFADLLHPGEGEWIRENVAFPDSMVDRITPVTTDEERDYVRDTFGYVDAWPVACEDFVQWVIEDHFPTGRPRWETVGAQLVADVAPYEQMKLRLLNASHQAMCYFGKLAGYTYVHEAMKDPRIVGLLRRYMQDEGAPTLPPVPGVDVAQYQQRLIERFGNPAIKDTLARLCAESSDRIPKWLMPVVRDNLAAGRRVEVSAAVVASWARYAEGIDEHGRPMEVVDRLRESLQATAHRQKDDILAFIKNATLFGDIADDARFTEPYERYLRSLYASGAAETMLMLQRAEER